MRGTLILVVGPSGAGKDTLIAGAKEALARDPRFVFARRAITRATGPGDEAHEPITRATFEARRAEGGFLLSWEAHGLGYGLAAALDRALADGKHVVANVSRAVVAEAMQRYSPVAVVAVSAPAAVLAVRLAARGREDVTDLAERMSRAGQAIPRGAAVWEVANDGTVSEGVARFVAALQAIAVPAIPAPETKPGA